MVYTPCKATNINTKLESIEKLWRSFHRDFFLKKNSCLCEPALLNFFREVGAVKLGAVPFFF
jgi:hypothetical protein